MKKIYVSLLFVVSLLISTIGVYAQQEVEAKPSNWKFSFQGGLTGSQAYYSNWAAGGDNSVAGRLFATHSGAMKKKRSAFDYNVDLALGYQWLFANDNNPLNKTDDRMNLDVNYGYKISDKHDFYYTAFVSFRSQFANGLNKEGLVTSKFMAPGYLTYGLGVEYKLNGFLDVMISPAALRNTFVLNDSVWLQKNYGINQIMIDHGQHVRTEFGANIAVTFNKDIAKNINLNSKLTLYSDYLNEPQNIDVNFEVGMNFKINSFLSAGVMFNYIYDDDVKFTVVEKGITKVGVPRSQFKESIYIGLVYKLK